MATIREHFQRQQKVLTRAVVVVGMAMVLATMYFLPKLNGFLAGLIIGVVLAPFMIAYIWTAYRCPRCQVNFLKLRWKQQRGWFTSDRRMFWEMWDACPNCGIRFDAQMPMGPSNPIGG